MKTVVILRRLTRVLLGRLWAGRVYGTNTGNVFLELNGEDAGLSGVFRLNEPSIGIVVYAIAGSFDGNSLSITGEPQTQLTKSTLGRLIVTARLDPRGNLSGQWGTDTGSAGTFELFPHDRPDLPPHRLQKQLHTARHRFGAIEVDRNQIIALADEMQADFRDGKVVVTTIAGTEQSRFLEDFKKISSNAERASTLKIVVQQPEGTGVNRIASVEFGQNSNILMTQAGDEVWVLGMLEKLKRVIQQFERPSVAGFKFFGFTINQALGFFAIIVLLTTLINQAILMAIDFLLAFIFIGQPHHRSPSFAMIHLGTRPEGLLTKIRPEAMSLLIAVTGGLLVIYLQGWLGLKLP